MRPTTPPSLAFTALLALALACDGGDRSNGLGGGRASTAPPAPETAVPPAPGRARPDGPGPAMRPPGWTPPVLDEAVVPVNGSAASSGGSLVLGLNDMLPGIPALYRNVGIWVPATGSLELFLLQVPAVPPPALAPLLVVFHGFGVSHQDVFVNTTFLAEASARGWYVFAPLGRSTVGNATVSFGSVDSQTNTHAGLCWVLQHFNVDPTRIYGAGFSMGGGALVSFAARHLDESQGTFAALVNHTGSVALSDVYYSDPGARPLLEALFGGPPWTHAFAYHRSSAIELDPITRALVPGGDHMAQNLAHVPMQTWYATQDPIAYLTYQSDRLNEYLAPVGNHTLIQVPASVHRWDTLDFTAACDWLAQHSLALPASGPLLVDRDGTFLGLAVEQQSAGAFTRLFFGAVPAQNRFNVLQSRNLTRVTASMARFGLDSAFAFTLVLDAADGQPDEVRLTGYTTPPGQVTRDGVPNAVLWSWDASSATLTVTETDPGTHTWSFRP